MEQIYTIPVNEAFDTAVNSLKKILERIGA